MRSAARRCPEIPGALTEPKGAPSANPELTDGSGTLRRSVLQATHQTSCGRAGMQRGTSDACALCSGCAMRIAGMCRAQPCSNRKVLLTSGNAASGERSSGRSDSSTSCSSACAHPRKRIVTPSTCHQRARQASSVHAKLHLDRGVRFRKNIRPGRHSFPATEPGSTARSRARRGGAGTGRDGVERRTNSALEGRAGPARGREGL